MRTTPRNIGTNGKTRRGPVVSTLAAVCMALPLSGLLGGTALAADDVTTATPAAAALKVAAADKSNATAAQAAADAKKDDVAPAVKTAENKPADFIGPVVPAKKAEAAKPEVKAEAAKPTVQPTPFVNQGGVTTGSNTTKYETVADKKGSTFTGVGGGQPSGNIKSPQPYSKADQNNTGANDTSASNPYRSTRDGSPSLNGNGGGQQVGQPCAGCVGKADNKNPPGQAPNATDRNAGYECDRNHGIGRSNPAHTACTTGTVTPPPPPPPACVPAAGQDANCKPINPPKCVPVAGQDANCKPINPPKCVPVAGQDANCKPINPPKCVPVAGQDANCKPVKEVDEQKITICHATGSETNPFVEITISKNGLNGHEDHADDIIPAYTFNGVSYPAKNPGKVCGGTPPKTPDCKGVMGGNAKPSDCTPPKTPDCKGVMGGNATPGDCAPKPPVVCPAADMVGPVPAGCRPPSTPITGTPGGEAVGNPPIVGKPPVRPVVGQGTPPQVITGTPEAPARGTVARPTALPFTGTDALLLAQLAALMLLVGAGLVGMSRRRQAIRVS